MSAKRLTKEDIRKTTGILNPVGHVVLAFKNDSVTAEAVTALRGLGFTEQDILAYTAERSDAALARTGSHRERGVRVRIRDYADAPLPGVRRTRGRLADRLFAERQHCRADHQRRQALRRAVRGALPPAHQRRLDLTFFLACF